MRFGLHYYIYAVLYAAISCATFVAITALCIIIGFTHKTKNHDVRVVDDNWIMRPLEFAAAQHNAVTDSLVRSW